MSESGLGTINVAIVDDHILTMEIDRPAKLNGFTPEMMDGLVAAFTRLDEDEDLWCGLVHAAGPHFTAGLDLPRFQERMQAGERSMDRVAQVDPTSLGRTCRKPVVYAVKGITYTVGIELMLGGDIAVAADDCRFRQHEPLRGIHATGGATIRFVERGGWGNAMYHLLTSDEFTAAEAFRIGLVQEVVAAGREYERALELARLVCEGAPKAVQATKASSLRYLLEGHDAARGAFSMTQSALASTEDFQEGLRSFIEKRPPKFQGR
jgi:enoyl-CoA hydratase/carnithine racemase